MAKAMQSKGTNILVYILIGLLILGLAGFGIGSFTSSITAIGEVGDQEITVDDYYQQLQTEIDLTAQTTGQRFTPSQAIVMGLGQRALETLVLRAALDNEAQKIGLSVGDQTILEVLASMPQFQGVDGNFNRDAYDFVLERSTMTAADFDQSIRDTQTRILIEKAIGDGIPVSKAYVDHLSNHYLSTRDVSWAMLPVSLLDEEIPAPSDQDLRDYHNANAPEFTEAEVRHLTVAWITPQLIADSDRVATERVRELYDERIEQFAKPERRDVDRLVFPDSLAADEARQRLNSNTVTFDELIAERDVVASDISLGIVTREDMSQDVANEIFSADTTAVVGPLKSELGPALYRINAILGSELTTFEMAQPDLAAELANQDAIETISNNVSFLEDIIAGGATIEEVVNESDLVLEKITYEDGITTDGPAAFREFRDAVMAAEEGDFPELLTLGENGLFAFRLDEIVAPRLKPFASVREAVVTAWNNQKLSEALAVKARELSTQLRNGKSFEELGLTLWQSETSLGRSDVIDGAHQSLANVAFSTLENEVAAFGDGNQWGVVRVNSVTPADLTSENTARTIEALEQSFSAGLGQDVVALFSNHLRREDGLQLNLDVIDAIHAQLP